MEPTDTVRPAPRIIRVPPPEGEAISRRVLSTVAIAIAVAGSILAVALAAGDVIGAGPALIIALGGLGLAGFFAWLPRPVNAAYLRKRAEFLAGGDDVDDDPLVSAVAGRWTRPSRLPNPDDIRAALQGLDGSSPGRAHVVCLGMIDVPQVDDVFFEPEIITPTRALGAHLWFVPVAVVVLALWVLQLVHVIPGRAINIGSFGYVLMMGISAGFLWVWRTAIRPTYIRMAPGVIQVLEYHHRHQKPTIRSYPLDHGTLAVVQSSATGRKPGLITVTLLRDEQKDRLDLWRMRKRDAIIERTWQALLSTAPTPPLSDQDLLG